MKYYNNYMGINDLDLRSPDNTWGDNIYIYKGFEFAQWMIDDALYNDYKYELENGSSVDDIALNEYIRYNLENYLDDCLFGLTDIDIEFLRDQAPTWFEWLGDNLFYSDDYDYADGYPTTQEILDYYNGISFTVGDFIN